MSNHTPGPWTVGMFLTNGGQKPVVSADRRIALADSQTDFERGQGWQHECAEREANARLIAAAPDMLAILQRLRDSFPGYIPDFIEAVNAAIDKATKAP